MNELQNKVITIESVETKTMDNGSVKFKIKSSDNMTFGLWKTKKDQTETKAYIAFKELGLDSAGKEVGITYKETPGDYQGKPITYRDIVMLTLDPSSMRIPSTPSVTIDVAKRLNILENDVKALQNALNIPATTPETPPVATPTEPDTSDIKVEDIPF